MSRGSRPSTPPGTSVASVNSRIGCVGEQQDREDHLDDLLGGLELDVEDEHGVLPRGEDDAGDQQCKWRGDAVSGEPPGDQRPAEQQQQDDDEREHRSQFQRCA